MVNVRQSNTEFDRWADFRAAVKTMIDDGTYERLVRIHASRVQDPDGLVRTRHRMHGAMYGPVGFRRFLPWHRAYLIAFERELRKIDASLSLPYWDWDNDQGRLVGVENFLAISSGRDLGLRPGVESTSPDDRAWFSSDALTESFETFTGDYYFFSRALETGAQVAGGTIVGQHGAGHNWIGGDMANTLISPNDIIFWMHHAAVDRVWAKWQTNNPGESAFLTGREARLDPWGTEFTVENIDDISDLGDDSYEYVDPVRPAPEVPILVG